MEGMVKISKIYRVQVEMGFKNLDKVEASLFALADSVDGISKAEFFVGCPAEYPYFEAECESLAVAERLDKGFNGIIRQFGAARPDGHNLRPPHN